MCHGHEVELIIDAGADGFKWSVLTPLPMTAMYRYSSFADHLCVKAHSTPRPAASPGRHAEAEQL